MHWRHTYQQQSIVLYTTYRHTLETHILTTANSTIYYIQAHNKMFINKIISWAAIITVFITFQQEFICEEYHNYVNCNYLTLFGDFHLDTKLCILFILSIVVEEAEGERWEQNILTVLNLHMWRCMWS